MIFSSELEAEIRSRGVIENLLRTADFSTEMDLVFQPIVDAMSEHTAGFEVWRAGTASASAWSRRPTSFRQQSASA